MGIASGIFWIMIGILYIIYQAFKAAPADTAACILLCVAVVVGLGALYGLQNLLLEWNLAVGIIYTIVAFGGLIGGLIYWIVTSNKKDKQKADELIRIMNLTKEALEMEESTYSDEEIKAFMPTWLEKYANLAEKARYEICLKYHTLDIDDFIPRVRKAYRDHVRYPIVYESFRSQSEILNPPPKARKNKAS